MLIVEKSVCLYCGFFDFFKFILFKSFDCFDTGWKYQKIRFNFRFHRLLIGRPWLLFFSLILWIHSLFVDSLVLFSAAIQKKKTELRNQVQIMMNIKRTYKKINRFSFGSYVWWLLLTGFDEIHFFLLLDFAGCRT